MKRLFQYLVLSTVLPLTACELTPLDASPVKSLPAITTASSVVVPLKEIPELYVIDFQDGEVSGEKRIQSSGLITQVSPLHLDRDSDSLAVLSSEAQSLDLIDIVTGEAKSYDLMASYDGLLLSNDGRYALAYFSSQGSRGLFQNENSLAHIDLDPALPPEDAVTTKSLSSLGGSPRGILLSPSLSGSRYAFVLSDEHVAIFDLTDPSLPEKSVPLVSLTSSTKRSPKSLSFAKQDETLWAFVTTEEGQSAYVISLQKSEQDASGMKIKLNQVPYPKGSISSLVTLSDGTQDGLYIVAANPSQDHVQITNIETGQSKSAQLSYSLNRLKIVPSEHGPEAFVWSSASRLFHLINLNGVLQNKAQSILSRSMHSEFSNLIAIPDSQKFMVIHERSDKGLSIYNMETDRVTSFGQTGEVRSVLIDPDLRRAFIQSSESNKNWLVTMDIDSFEFELSEIPIESNLSSVASLTQVNTLVAISPSTGGNIAAWPLDKTDDAHAIAIPGFLLNGLLSR